MMIEFVSLSSEELEGRKTVPCMSEVTYEAYVAHLDAIQRATRASLSTEALPNVHAGDDRETVRCSR